MTVRLHGICSSYFCIAVDLYLFLLVFASIVRLRLSERRATERNRQLFTYWHSFLVQDL